MGDKHYELRILPLFENDLNEIVDYIVYHLFENDLNEIVDYIVYHLRNPTAAEKLG